MKKFLIGLILVLITQSCSFNGDNNRLIKRGLIPTNKPVEIEQIIEFFDKHPSVDSFGMNNEIHWFKFSIDNFNEGENAIVVPDYQINILRLFLVSDSANSEEILVTGDEIPVSEYTNKSRSNVAIVKLEKGHQYYIVAQYSRPGNRPQLAIQLKSVPEYLKHSTQLEWSYGIIYGLLIVYLLLVLTIWIWTSDSKYFFFLLWVLSYLVYFSTTSGHLKFYIFPEMGSNFSLIRLEFMLISMYAMTEFSLLYYNYRKAFKWVIWIWYFLMLWSLTVILYEPIMGESIFEGNEKAYILLIRAIFFGFITLQTYLSVKWIVVNRKVSFLSVIFVLYLLNMFLYLYQTVYLDDVDFDYFILATVWFLVIEILSIAGGVSFYLMKSSQRNLLLAKQNTQLKKEINRVYFNVQEQEKRRIAREIHDDILNRLSMLLLLSRDGYLSQPKLVERLRLLSKDIKLYTLGLYPIWVKKMTLNEMIEQNIQELCTALHLEFKYEVAKDLPLLETTMKLQIFRILFEFISNSGKYAQAKCINLNIEYHPFLSELIINIFDDGKGLQENHKPGLGIMSIQNRVSILNGKMTVQNKKSFGLEWNITLPLQNSHLGKLQNQSL